MHHFVSAVKMDASLSFASPSSRRHGLSALPAPIGACVWCISLGHAPRRFCSLRLQTAPSPPCRSRLEVRAMIFSVGEARHYQVEPAFALRVAEAAWNLISAFFSNIECVLVSSVLHVVCKMYNNLSYSIDLTGLLALRFYAALSLVETQARLRICNLALAIYVRS